MQQNQSISSINIAALKLPLRPDGKRYVEEVANWAPRHCHDIFDVHGQRSLSERKLHLGGKGVEIYVQGYPEPFVIPMIPINTQTYYNGLKGASLGSFVRERLPDCDLSGNIPAKIWSSWSPPSSDDADSDSSRSAGGALYCSTKLGRFKVNEHVLHKNPDTFEFVDGGSLDFIDTFSDFVAAGKGKNHFRLSVDPADHTVTFAESIQQLKSIVEFIGDWYPADAFSAICPLFMTVTALAGCHYSYDSTNMLPYRPDDIEIPAILNVYGGSSDEKAKIGILVARMLGIKQNGGAFEEPSSIIMQACTNKEFCKIAPNLTNLPVIFDAGEGKQYGQINKILESRYIPIPPTRRMLLPIIAFTANKYLNLNHSHRHDTLIVPIDSIVQEMGDFQVRLETAHKCTPALLAAAKPFRESQGQILVDKYVEGFKSEYDTHYVLRWALATFAVARDILIDLIGGDTWLSNNEAFHAFISRLFELNENKN